MRYKEFIDLIKKNVRSATIPPHYNPNEWNEKEFNCYAYALGICMNFDDFDRIVPGFLSRGILNDYNDTKEETIQYFKYDCEILGYKVTETTLDEKIGKNGYKIAAYVSEYRDFHFVRQDSNGNWSEKRGWGGKIEIRKEEDIVKNSDKYEFIGIFIVSKKE